MKKIAIITTGLSKILAGEKCGGGEILLNNLIHTLKNIPDVRLFIFTPDEKETTQNIIKKYPEITFYIYNQSPVTYYYMDEIEKIAEKEKFDKILNANMVLPYKTTFLQSHSYIHKINKNFYLFRLLKILIKYKYIKAQKYIFQRSITNSDFIAVSNKIKDDYASNFNIPDEKFKVLYPGVHIKSYNKPLKKDYITFGIAANSSINKGGHYLLFALGILNLSGKKFNLQMIAPKYKKDLLMQLMVTIFNIRSKVTFLPYQNNIADFYEKIDVLVVPSFNEAFGLVTLEAMERGKPCIVSSTAGSSEIITASNGIVFNRNSFFNFIRQLNKMIKLYNDNFEEYKKISENARKTAQEYSWEKFALKAAEINE